MRTRLMSVTAALVLASAITAAAQTATPAPQAPAAGSTAPISGTIDFGGLFGDVNGDEARYERYRDTRNGLHSDLVLRQETDRYAFDARASHIGYRDQRYEVAYDRDKLKFKFLFDSTPTNYTYMGITPWTRDGNVLSLPDDLQRGVEARTLAGIPCAYATSCSNLATAAAALARGSVYSPAAQRGVEIQTKRETLGFGLTYHATDAIDLDMKFTSTAKSGTMPWAGAFAFNNINEFPLPVDHRTNDFSAGVEWASAKAMLRLGWDGSYFSNDIQTIVWDNPIRFTDFNNGTAAPWDASGYSNGNGPAQGRMSLWPDSTMNVFSVTGLYKFPHRTTVNGTVQLTKQDQDGTIMPWTINGLINQLAPSRGYPGLAALPRATAEAGVDALNALINFNSRPTKYLTLQGRYRYNERDVTTPPFDASYNVRFDAVPEFVPETVSHQYDIHRSTLDLNGTVNLPNAGAVRVGYTHDAFERHGRGFSDVSENVVRASYDLISRQYFTVRAGVDYGQRRGEGFVLEGIDYETGTGGEQPGLRFYDEADRDRTRGNVTLTITPVGYAQIFVSYAGGKEEYMADDSVPPGREFFGLLDAKVKAFNVGLSLSPNDTVSLGANYGRDEYQTLQNSRNANPPPDASWTDPSRNWTLDNDEQVNNFNVWMDLFKLGGKADVRVGYDYSDSDNSFIHGGPRVATLTAAGTFVALPNVTNTWHRLTADLKYYFARNVGVALGYYYEKLDVSDFNTIDTNGSVGFTAATGQPRLDYLGGLITGYGNRPYDGQHVSLRLLYTF